MIKTIAFDIFGTVVDWRGTIIRECRRLGVNTSLAQTWAEAYVQATREEYQPIDKLLYLTGCALLDRCGLDPNDREAFIHIWHRLEPWPDVIDALWKLKRTYTLATLTNANYALMFDLMINSHLPFDLIIDPDDIKVYKPNPLVYETAIKRLALEPSEILMVAAHMFDLHAAKVAGMQTAYIIRPGEESKSTVIEADFIVTDLNGLYEELSS